MSRYSILFVIDGLEFGGGERVFLQLAAGLRGRHQVFVATNAAGKLAHELAKLGVKFFPVNMTHQLSFKPILQLRNIIRRQEIDLVHSQGARADFFARFACRFAGVPNIVCTIAMPVEGFEVGSLRKKIYRLIDRFSERYAKHFIVVSDSLKKSLTEGRGISTKRVVRIYNGVELDHYHHNLEIGHLRGRWGIPLAAPLIGAIGRMVWQKGFEYLIKAFPTILQVTPEARLILVGDGPLRKKLKDLAESLSIKDRVIFPGFISDIKQVLSDVDVLVIPSILEGLPMVTLEAMAMSKPIVATQIQGVVEQLSDGREGILVPPKNPEALARAVLIIVQHRELSARLGAAARIRVEKFFSVEKMLRETEEVYLSLLKADGYKQLFASRQG